MADLPSVQNNGKVSSYFAKVQQVGIPETATNRWLESLGFKSKNDRGFVGFLKALGFADSAGKPTQIWSDYRHTDLAPGVMATAIQKCYEPLFEVYPDAAGQSDDSIRNWMRSHAQQASAVTVDRALASFRAVCDLADFNVKPVNRSTMPVESPRTPEPQTKTVPDGRSGSGPNIHLDIQIHIPVDASPAQIDQIFASMAKHLYSS